MTKGNENRVKFNISLIFLITLLVIGGILFYLNTLRTRIEGQKSSIEEKYATLTLANTLITDINKAQEEFYRYIDTQDSSCLKEFNSRSRKIEGLIRRIIAVKPQEKQRLIRLETLLKLKVSNISTLGRLLQKQESHINFDNLLKKYEEEIAKGDSITIKGTADTIRSEIPNKKFFRRLAALFRPGRDTLTIVNAKEDYRVRAARDTLKVVYEISDIAKDAIVSYENRLDSIHNQIIDFTLAERRISSDISSLLTGFHTSIIQEVMSHTDYNEKDISSNYTSSLIAGSFIILLLLLFIILTARDIRKDKKYREQIENANITIRNTMESRHKLLLSITHDIKSPLSSILGYLELLEKDGINVRSMQNSGRHILTMLQNLLEYSSLEQGRQQTSYTAFNISNLCRETYEMFLPVTEKKGIILDYRATDADIENDLTKIRQIIVNLVSNAVKYTEKGSIAISMLYKNGSLRIIVSDTGAGMPEEKIEKLFQPFERLEENNRLAEGTGLGMFVVKGIVGILNGKIEVRSSVGKGTRITVTLPAKKAVDTTGSTSLKIKVIDDDPIIEQYVCQMLEKLGHTVVEEQPDIILSDMEMGKINGLDILSEAGDVPVVIMTGRVDFTTEKAHEMGFRAYLQKPFGLEALKNVFGDATQKNRSAKEELIGDNRAEIEELFRKNTKENFIRLQQTLQDNDFETARALCHKMLPSFILMELPSEDLKTMDRHRNTPFPEWKECVERIIQISIP